MTYFALLPILVVLMLICVGLGLLFTLVPQHRRRVVTAIVVVILGMTSLPIIFAVALRSGATTSAISTVDVQRPPIASVIETNRWRANPRFRASVHPSIDAASRDLARRLQQTFAAADQEPEKITIESSGDHWPGQQSELNAAAAIRETMPALIQVPSDTIEARGVWTLHITVDASADRDAVSLRWSGNFPVFREEVDVVDKRWVDPQNPAQQGWVVGRSSGASDPESAELEAVRDAAVQIVGTLGGLPPGLNHDAATDMVVKQIRTDERIGDRFVQHLIDSIGGMPAETTRGAVRVKAGAPEYAVTRILLDQAAVRRSVEEGAEERERRNVWITLGVTTLVITGLYLLVNYVTRDFYRGRLRTVAVVLILGCGVLAFGLLS